MGQQGTTAELPAGNIMCLNLSVAAAAAAANWHRLPSTGHICTQHSPAGCRSLLMPAAAAAPASAAAAAAAAAAVVDDVVPPPAAACQSRCQSTRWLSAP